LDGTLPALKEQGLEIMVGLVLAGMILGATAAGVWLLTGGSLLLAVALYGLLAGLCMLVAAMAVYLASGRREIGEIVDAEGLRVTR
jgi:hypothetical protein